MINNLTNENEKYINIILTQTNMSYEEALQKLNEYNNDYMKVLYDYHGINNNPNSKSNSTNNTNNSSINQMIYKEIRIYMNSLDNIRKK